VQTHGLGEFDQLDYFIVCRPTYYGDSFLYIPDTSLISRVTSDPSAATDDELTITPALSVQSGDWLLNLGADTAGTPLTTPNYDGSDVALYSDPVGNNADANPYLLTGQGGNFQGWIEGGYYAVDLLITNPSGGLVMAMPTFNVGREIM
jgi:hypothetical protein